MTTEHEPYLLITVFVIAALGFAISPLFLAWLWSKFFSPKKPGPQKNAIYECGLESKGDAWVQFRSEYYLYAIIFLIFDVETIFLLPFAVAFTGLPVGAFIAMMVFLLLLVEGLVWAWRKGVLKWS
ncbi:MAG TPA: NADH-quinone oxidoreductase subunit A [Verrucomicrobiae bacterium]|nr:NADH-quinone oxidoreductase subunit A [Verrucomicrobiae bacterium]